MIPADRILIDGDTGWWVVDREYAEPDHGLLDIIGDRWLKALNRPCETCDGRGTALWEGPCDCIDGRHTFDLEVEKPRWGEPEPTQGSPLMSRPLLHTTTYRVAIIEILPIEERRWPQSHTSSLVTMHPEGSDCYPRHLHWTVGEKWAKETTLPSAAAPGMFAVRLKIAH